MASIVERWCLHAVGRVMSRAYMAIGAAIVAGIGAGVGWVANSLYFKKEKERMKGEVEEANKDVASVLATFKLESSRMEKIICDIATKKPNERAGLMTILRLNGLNDLQAGRIADALYGEKAGKAA